MMLISPKIGNRSGQSRRVRNSAPHRSQKRARFDGETIVRTRGLDRRRLEGRAGNKTNCTSSVSNVLLITCLQVKIRLEYEYHKLINQNEIERHLMAQKSKIVQENKDQTQAIKLPKSSKEIKKIGASVMLFSHVSY